MPRAPPAERAELVWVSLKLSPLFAEIVQDASGTDKKERVAARRASLRFCMYFMISVVNLTSRNSMSVIILHNEVQYVFFLWLR